MEQEQMMLYGNEFMKCIESIDLQKEDMADVYPELKKRFSRFAQLLHLARSTVTVHVSPNSFEPEGGEHSFTIVYNPDHGPDEYSITVNHYVVLDAHGSARMWPVLGHVWTEAEKRTVRTMSKFIFMMVSRSVLIKIMRQLSYIDAPTGLANMSGIHQFMGRVEAQGKLNKYAISFLNLKNFKYYNQRFGSSAADYLLKQYSLALYRFINHEEEIVARPGGDNFMVL